MRRILLVLLLVPSLALWGCGGSDDDNGPTGVSPEDQVAAEEAATESMSDLMDDMETAVGDDFDPDDIDALMDMDMSGYGDGFEAALEIDPNCGPAHFGLAFVEMVTMAQEDDLQNIIDEFGNEFGDAELPIGVPLAALSTGSLLDGGLLGRSFTILRHSPLALSPQEIRFADPGSDKADGPLIRNLQTHIRNVTLPQTQSIVDHLTRAEADPDFLIQIITTDAEPDTVEIDLGEVYVLDAVVRALRSGLQIATAYDVELAPDGDYTWLTEAFTSGGYTRYEIESGVTSDTLYLYDDEEVEARRTEAIMAGFENLLTPGSYFLTLWTDPWSGENAMQSAFGEIQTLLVKLEAAYEFIQNETDNQDNDLIAQYLMAELDEAIVEIGEDLPDYLGTWETLPDVIAWIESFLSGPYTIPVEISDTETFDLAVDISALFVEPVADWKTKLPYMEWLDFAEWAVYDDTAEYGPYTWNPIYPFVATVNGEEMSFDNIGTYYTVEIDWDTEMPFAFLDGPDGDPVEGEMFYFPDYTFGGLFPDMDRAGWITLLEGL